MKKPAWLVVLVPLIAMFVVALLGIGFQKTMMGDFSFSPQCRATAYSPENSRSLGGMFSFAAASQLLFSVQCVAALFALLLIWRRSSTWRAAVLIGAMVLGLACALIPREAFMPTTVEILNLQVEKNCPNATEFVVLQERGGAFAVGLLACALAILLVPATADTPDTDRDLASRMRSLTYVLYVGTALLIASMLRLSALYEWVVLVAQDSAQESLKLLASSLMRVWGVYYATLLATIYLPAYLILRQRANVLVGTQGTEAQRAKWLEERGLTLSVTDILTRLAAILAPILAGEAGKLVGLLGG
ncbi:MAG TPA: hypothetical protein VF787_26275 [Thermoanaerobaculia bacterium]